ncbi:DNA integrity scanning protein DisA [Propionispora sp. 2/2-37]|uniref:DNA integrity scanning diadenylate cyclase DisA n=1 Tax=Propionispora sp. 2/2-37 TaxID=1677858 RepID=UPI0006BB7211|nr:DNA integrity scanning diadenylate cyclase DisA [Propionispora sp. 2/2-37]CUH97748.1 DNA integrity scanning protein DisA [Propionispora sp. 2/2-37]
MTKTREEKLWDERFIKAIKSLSPGTALREGLEHVLRARMGALVAFGDQLTMKELVDGGFALDCEFTPAGFYELAKMDGALLLSPDAKRILYANAQLIPDASILTTETGTRHRTAERVARQTGNMVIAISQRRNVITLYLGHLRYTLKDITIILNRANQALQTLEKYKRVFQKSIVRLDVLEFDAAVTLSEVAALIIRGEKVCRIAREIERNALELGQEGRLVTMQLEELLSDVDELQLLLQDYHCSEQIADIKKMQDQLVLLPEDELVPHVVCRMLGYAVTPASALDIPVVPRGYRILRKIPRLPLGIIENVIACFKNLSGIYQASSSELDAVEGIGEIRAKTIKDGLQQVRQQALFDRYI